MARRVRALLAVVRWQNALLSAAGVLVGAWWAGGRWQASGPILAALAGVLLTAYANAFNDLCDVEIDRVAHPDRPLPSGALEQRDVRILAAAAAVLAIGLATVAEVGLGWITAAVVAVMTLYSLHLSRWGFVGNLVVAGLASLPFLYGAISVGALRRGLPLLYVAVPLHLAREVAKDLDDAKGDAPYRRTLPLSGGPQLARGVLLAALAVFGWQAAALAVSAPRLALALVPAFVLCAVAAMRAVGARPGAPLLLKTAMLAAMVALLAARWLDPLSHS